MFRNFNMARAICNGGMPDWVDHPESCKEREKILPLLNLQERELLEIGRSVTLNTPEGVLRVRIIGSYHLFAEWVPFGE